MGDFLSNFDQSNYNETKSKKTDKSVEEMENQLSKYHNENVTVTTAQEFVDGSDSQVETKQENKESVHRSLTADDVEIDLSYNQKKKQKQRKIAGGIVGILCIILFVRYQMTHVKLPDFTGKDLSACRSWATENKIKMKVNQKYHFDVAANKIISQKQKKGEKIKKGQELSVTASLGADPNQKIKLPDFLKMTKGETEKWIKDNKADNLSIIEEYNEKIEKGKAVRFEIVNKEVAKENYKRKDKANMYFSKGKETFEKNISVPDFVRKNKTEVETWAKTNDIKVKYEEASSTDVPEGRIISQGIAQNEKIAKKDSMTVTVSLGKGYTIPNFSEYTLEEANNAVEGIMIQAKSVFTESIPYGQLISQSIAAGTQLTTKDELKVTVHYSAGKPYIKDLRGSYLEGDLQKYFYDEFQSKGANIQYSIHRVDSAEPQGTVVGMSEYNTYLPLSYTVTIDVSLGNLPGASDYSQNQAKKGGEENQGSM